MKKESESEIENLTPHTGKLSIGGREREIRFTFSSWRAIQNEFGTMAEFLKKFEEDFRTKPFSTLPHIVWLGLKDREGVTEETVLDDYGVESLRMISVEVCKALYGALPQTDGAESKKK